MSLLIAVVVAFGFSQTIDMNLIHPSIPRPFLLGRFPAWILPQNIFYVGVDLLILLGVARDLIVNGKSTLFMLTYSLHSWWVRR